MKNTTIKKNANKVVWVQYWIEHMDQSREIELLDAEKDNKGNYKCVINLPVINQTVEVTNESHLDAVLIAADKASKLIEEFTAQHSDKEVHKPFQGIDYEAYVDDTDFLMVSMTKESRRKSGKELEDMLNKSIKTINKAIENLQKIFGLTDQLYLHITTKDIYDESMKVDDIVYAQEQDIEKNKNWVFIPVTSYEKDKYVVTLAHIGKKAN